MVNVFQPVTVYSPIYISYFKFYPHSQNDKIKIRFTRVSVLRVITFYAMLFVERLLRSAMVDAENTTLDINMTEMQLY